MYTLVQVNHRKYFLEGEVTKKKIQIMVAKQSEKEGWLSDKVNAEFYAFIQAGKFTIEYIDSLTGFGDSNEGLELSSH